MFFDRHVCTTPDKWQRNRCALHPIFQGILDRCRKFTAEWADPTKSCNQTFFTSSKSIKNRYTITRQKR